MTEQLGLIPFQYQLEEYPAIKEMLLKNVKNPPYLEGAVLNGVPRKPWRVYGQQHEGGKWGKKDFPTYLEAFKFFKVRMKTYHDISITSKARSFSPPGRIVKIRKNGKPLMVKVKRKGKEVLVQETRFIPVSPPPGHEWCMYCRRFTVFTWFIRHHAIPGEITVDPGARRCCICGIREVTGAWQARR